MGRERLRLLLCWFVDSGFDKIGIFDGDEFGKDDYPDDENWGGEPPVDGDDMDKDDYPEDEDWN